MKLFTKIFFYLPVICFIISVNNKSYAQWTQINVPININSIAVSGSNVVVGGTGQVYFSTNDGASWAEGNTGLPSSIIVAITFSGTNIFAGTYGAGVFRSTDNGTNWTEVNTGLTSLYIYEFAVKENHIFAGGFDVFLSTNAGTSWTTSLELSSDAVSEFAIGGSNIFTSTLTSGVHRSTNNGTDWTPCGLVGYWDELPIAFNGSNLIAANQNAAYISTDFGTTWSTINIASPFPFPWCFVFSGTTIFTGTLQGELVYISTDSGTSWNSVATGLTNTSGVYNIYANSTYLFISTSDGGLWRRPLAEMITAVELISDDLPTHFNLEQNYPNPFNPTTAVSWQLPVSGWQSLKVYDMIGNEVATLVDEYKLAGIYKTEFNAANLPSGVYFYQLRAGSYIETKKMILLK